MKTFSIQKQKITIIAFLAIILFAQVPARFAMADAITDATTGLNNAAAKAYGTTPQGDIPALIGKFIGAALSFIGLIFFILVIYGGFLWMTARGNQQQVTQALDLIIAAVVGLVIIAGAYLITQYIGESILSQTTTSR